MDNRLLVDKGRPKRVNYRNDISNIKLNQQNNGNE